MDSHGLIFRTVSVQPAPTISYKFPEFNNMAQNTLDNIPTELIMIILDVLKPEDVLKIAKVCRRLNLIAVPHFLGRKGMPNPETICIVKASSRIYRDELAALSIHFSMTSVDQFFCIVSHRQDLEETFIPPMHVYWLTLNLVRINQMLSRLISVGSLYLVIDSWGSGWSLRSDVVQTFMDAVLQLTETAILKSCKSLQILHSHPTSAERICNFKLVGKDTNLGIVKATFRSLTRSMSHYLKLKDQARLFGKGWKYEWQSSPASFNQLLKSCRAQSQLTHIDLDSEFLLIPPSSSWTFDVMKYSPIVSLSISVPSIITKEEFDCYLFPNLSKSVPRLREFKCAFPDDHLLKTVVENLHAMPLLEKFTIALSFMGDLPSLPPSLSKPTILHHLASFTGSPDQAAYFFGSGFPSAGGRLICPSLKDINLIHDTSYQDQNFQTDYFSIAEQIRSISTRMLEMTVVPSINLCLTNHGELPEDIPSPISDDVPHWIQHFRMVSRLTSHLHPPISHNEDDWESLHGVLISHALAWLNLFRGVKYLTLIIQRNDIDEGLLKSRLLDVIKASYPQLLMVNVVFLTVEPKRYHYHWSNACDDLQRGTSDIPSTPSFDKKSRDCYVCSNF